MKVYYRVNDIEYEFLYEITADLANEVVAHVLQKFKYRAMWELRHLEEEINQAGGVIIVTKKGIETKSFPEELSGRITRTLKSVDWDKW